MGFASGGLTAPDLDHIQSIPLLVDPCTVGIFQTNPATGDLTNADNVNDNVTAAVVEGAAVGKYTDVDLGGVYRIFQHRIFGHAGNGATSTWKIQTKGDASEAWEDWGTFTNRAGTWSAFKTETVRICRYIRFICVTVVGNDYLGEAEVTS